MIIPAHFPILKHMALCSTFRVHSTVYYVILLHYIRPLRI